jgi:SAM-dependent methyltransferase
MGVVNAREWLSHPITRGLDLDDPRTTDERRRLIASKPFLREIYEDWYTAVAGALPAGDGPVLEIGSGAGFLSRFVPGLITSEILLCSGIRLVLDGGHLPFPDGSLRGIAMTNVLHHLPEPRRFLIEAARCVRPGGAIVMIEPWVSWWSTFVYTRLHHEPFDPQAATWEFRKIGPLSGANGALPWVMFERDRARFEREFPQWTIDRVRPTMPFRYLLSGGVSMRSLTPAFTGPFWRAVERRLQPWMRNWAMFAEIRLLRRN